MTPRAEEEISVRSSLVRNRASSLGTSRAKLVIKSPSCVHSFFLDSLDQKNDFHVLFGSVYASPPVPTLDGS